MNARPLALALAAVLACAVPVAANEAPAKGTASAGHYLPFPGVTASVRTNAARRAVLAMDATLDVPDATLRGRAQGLGPRLRAAYAQALMVYAGGLPPGRPLDPEYLGREMQRQTDMVLGKPGAKFLIGSLLVN